MVSEHAEADRNTGDENVTERATLQKTIRNKKTCKTVLKCSQILLERDEEQGDWETKKQRKICSCTGNSFQPLLYS